MVLCKKRRNILRCVIFIAALVLMTFTASTGNASEKENNNIEFSIGYSTTNFKAALSEFSFSSPVIKVVTKLNEKLNFSINYTFGEGNKIIEDNKYTLKWKQWDSSFDYKILNDDKSLWVSLLYKEFGIKSRWRNEVDDDAFKGIGIGLSYNAKIKENLRGTLSLNYFPYLSSDIANYTNLELKGQLEYQLKNNRNSIALYYDNQNLNSLTNNNRDVKVTQIGIKFKTKIN